MADAVDLRERDFRLRPHRPRVLKDQSKAWSKSFKSLIRLVRMTTRPGRASGAMGRTASRRYRQRCAVRITYSPNRVRGQWAAHGRYIARESATRTRTAKEAGFTAGEEGVDVAGRLAEWQNAGDQRLFKMILSPEFGERIDVQRHARELMARMQRDLGTRLEWVAVAHYNTGHPHVHVALRGRTDAGPLRLERDYIQRGIREHAEDLCTAQLGFRTELDALEAERREVEGLRFTSLDRKVANHAFGPTGDGTIDLDTLTSPRTPAANERHHHLASRLRVLARLGFAEQLENAQYRIDPNFGVHLRSLGRANEIQRRQPQDRSRSASPQRANQL